MARNSAANLVGLAALGALGYKMLQNKKGDATSSAPVEDRAEASEAVPSGDLGDFNQANYNSGPARPGPGDGAVAEYVQNAPRVTPVKPAARKTTTPKAAAPTTDLRDRETGMSRGTRPDYREPPNVDIEAGMSRGTRSVRDTGDQGDRLLARYPAPKPEPKFFSDRGVMVYGRPYGPGMKKGGAVKAKKMASGGMTRSSASKRADGIATKGKTRGKMY